MNWELDTWANVLEIVGFCITILSLIVALFVKSELSKLKLSYIFDKRIKNHINMLSKSASKINLSLNNYNESKNQIKLELNLVISELQDLKNKLGFFNSYKTRILIWFIKARLRRPFSDKIEEQSLFWEYLVKYPNRLFKTTESDIWLVYGKLHGIIRQVENLKKNKDKAL